MRRSLRLFGCGVLVALAGYLFAYPLGAKAAQAGPPKGGHYDITSLAILDGGIVEPESRVLDTVTTALTLGSELEAVNPSGETALHIASAQGYESVVRALAERGANLNARNLRGQTPLGALVARKAARPNMIELLRKLGASM